MTREEREDAIDYFKRSYASGNTDDERHHNEVLDTAIEALEQEPCEDCISRQAVIEITAETGALETQARVRALPSVIPKEKTEGEALADIKCIKPALTLSENPTNGDVIKALFGKENVYIDKFSEEVNIYKNQVYVATIKRCWWNAPYKAKSEGKECR